MPNHVHVEIDQLEPLERILKQRWQEKRCG